MDKVCQIHRILQIKGTASKPDAAIAYICKPCSIGNSHIHLCMYFLLLLLHYTEVLSTYGRELTALKTWIVYYLTH